MARILVVEDDIDTRMVLGKLLAVAGHEVAPAANGWEALVVLDNSSIDLILLDVMMPGMDGVTFLQILRQAKKHQSLPVVVVTALDIVDIAERTRSFGVEQILPKTQKLLEDLMTIVNRIVGDSAQPGMEGDDTRLSEN